MLDAREHPLTVFFEPLRQTRRERRGRPDPRRRRALITMVHNEPVFLPIWLGYYSRFFAPQDIYVLDNETTDGSTDGEGFVRLPVAHDRVDHEWMVQTIEQLQHDLVERYDVVLTTDVDEIVTPNPEWGSLDQYLDGFEEDFVNCLGYEILHLRDREPPLRLDRPILDQRGHWFAADGYDKPALATVPMSWAPGFHTRSDGELALDPDLRLIHLHRVDYDICLERHRLRSRRSWNRHDLDAGWAGHNLIADEQEFARWFEHGECFEEGSGEMVLERIPASWQGRF